MALETVTHIADFVATNPTAGDAKSQGDDHIRNAKTALLNDLCGFAGAVACAGTDGGAVNAYTLTPTHALPAYGTKMLAVIAPTVTNTGACTLNISALGVKDIKSIAGAALTAGDLVSGSLYLLLYTGTEFRLTGITKNYVDQLAFNTALPVLALGFLGSDAATAGFTQTHTGYAQKEVKGADIACAATINLTTATGNLVHITGSTGPVTAITIPVGAEYVMILDSTPTFTHSASLLLPTAADVVGEAGDRVTVRGDTAGAIVIDWSRATGINLGAPTYIKVADIKGSSTSGGTSIANDITQTRTLNTVQTNTITGASLASNTVTLPAGTYEYYGRAPAVGSSTHQAFLYNSSDATYVGLGSSEWNTSAGTDQTNSEFFGRFTIASAKNFTIRHFIGNGEATIGLGTAVQSGQSNVYAELSFKKVA